MNEDGVLVRAHFEESNNDSDIEDGLLADGYESFIQNPGRTTRLRKEISEYCSGERREFTVPLGASGTPWQKKVWEALRRIPFGETRSYSQVADMVGSPGAARAVGGGERMQPRAARRTVPPRNRRGWLARRF